MAAPHLRPVSLDRMVNAVEKVRQRLERATKTLEAAKVPYIVVGGNAVAAWVSRVDEAAVRNTQDVDILLNRDDFTRAQAAMERAGFIYRHVKSIDMFLDGPDAKARDAVHVLFAGERVKSTHLTESPSIDEFDAEGDFRVPKLESLVRMKLTSFRDKDRMHLRDMIEVDLIDAEWPHRFRPELAERLQSLLDDPDG